MYGIPRINSFRIYLGWGAKEFVMEIKTKLGAKAMGFRALENNEGLNPNVAKVEDAVASRRPRVKSASGGSPTVRLRRSNAEDAVFLQRRICDIGFPALLGRS